MSNRQFTREESDTFAAIRAKLLDRAPYYASALYATIPVVADGLGTFAVDKRWRMYIDPAVFDEWGVEGSSVALEHELGHLLRDHASRAENIPMLNPKAWNWGADCEINDDIEACGLRLPVDGFMPETIGCDNGDIAEHYYDAIMRNCPPPPDGGSGDPGDGAGEPGDGSGEPGGGSGKPGEFDGCGSGAGGEAGAHEIGDEEASGVPERNSAEQEISRRSVADAVQKYRGTVPAGLKRWANDTLEPPTIPWQSILRSAVRRGLASVAGQVDYSWRRPSRRGKQGGFIRPSMVAPRPKVSIIIDTSGSMSTDDLRAALSETQGVLTRSGTQRRSVSIIAVDASAEKPQFVSDARKIKLKGGGGTDMRVGIRAAMADKKNRPDMVIVMTDGYTPWTAPGEVNAMVIAVLIGEHAPAAPDHIKSVWTHDRIAHT